MNPLTQAIRRLEEHFSVVRDYWRLQQKERGVGAVYLSLDNRLTYFTKPEIPDGTNGSLSASLALGSNRTDPDWTLVVIEIEKFPHKKFSWQLLAIDEGGRIRRFDPAFGFRLLGTQTTAFFTGERAIVEHRTPEGIESVSFSDRGGEA